MHRVLAESLPVDAVLQLALHWHGAGVLDKAATAALAAAQQAHTALAFDQAARLYQRWLLDSPADHPDRERWAARRAEALGQAGRHREAGESWLALGRQPGPTALVRRRRGVSHLMVAGELAQAYRELPALLSSLSLRMPAHGLRGYLELVYWTVRMRLFGPPRARPADPAQLLRADLLLALAESLILTDPLRGLQLQGRAIDAAYRTGDPRRLVPVIALRAVTEFSLGRARRAQELLAQADGLADDAHGRDSIQLWRAAIATYDARYQDALDLLDACAPDSAPDDSPHLQLRRTFRLLCLSQLGRIEAFGRQVVRTSDDAHVRGQRIAEMMYRSGFPVTAQLVHGDTDGVREELAHALRAWPESRGTVPWVFHQCSEVQLELYLGEPERALARVEQVEPFATANGALIGPAQHAWWHAVGATAALSAFKRTGASSALRRARKHVRALLRRPDRVNRITGITHELCCLAFEGRTGRALARLDEADTLARDAQHGWWAHYMQHMRGQLTGDASMVAQAESALRDLGVTEPEAFLRTFWVLPD